MSHSELFSCLVFLMWQGVCMCNCSYTAVIIQQLKARMYPVVRPQASVDDCDTPWLDVVEACWNEVPLQRPTAAAVKRTVRKLAQIK